MYDHITLHSVVRTKANLETQNFTISVNVRIRFLVQTEFHTPFTWSGIPSLYPVITMRRKDVWILDLIICTGLVLTLRIFNSYCLPDLILRYSEALSHELLKYIRTVLYLITKQKRTRYIKGVFRNPASLNLRLTCIRLTAGSQRNGINKEI